MWLEIILLLFLILILFYFYFQREPRITVDPQLSKDMILSPAYGTIYGIEEESENIHLIIILDLFDVHVQMYPYDGEVINQIHDSTGQYKLVYDIEKSSLNEKVITTLRTIHGDFVVQQIAGMFVRNISTTLDHIPQKVERGQKMGSILFGSRVDLILPKKSISGKTISILVEERQKVYGPLTSIGLYK
jgi:phosphatidylserine decarboxylase precursor-related protein